MLTFSLYLQNTRLVWKTLCNSRHIHAEIKVDRRNDAMIY